MIPEFLKARNDSVLLLLHAQPGAKKTELKGIYNGRLKIRVSAPPLEGRANNEIIAFFSKLLGLSKAHLQLKSGETSKLKTLEIRQLAVEDIAQLISKENSA